MRTVVRKVFWIWNFDKEEQWLNEMAAKGLALVSVGVFKYTFEECRPGDYNIRLELLENVPGHTESQNYIKFLEDTGAEYLGSVTRWVYFRKKTENGEFNLFSDNSSRIKQLNRILLLNGFAAVIILFSMLHSLYEILQTGMGVPELNIIFCICLFVSLWITCGFFRIYKKKRKLVKEKQLFE